MDEAERMAYLYDGYEVDAATSKAFNGKQIGIGRHGQLNSHINHPACRAPLIMHAEVKSGDLHVTEGLLAG